MHDLDFIETEQEEIEQGYATTFESAVIAAAIGGELHNFLKNKNLGRAFGGSVEYSFSGHLEHRQPDLSFVSQERLPTRFRSYPEIAPDLAVEVVSPSDKTYETEARILEYQNAGVKLIWIVNPYSRTVDVYRLSEGARSQKYLDTDKLAGEDILPGFELAISDIFDYPLDLDPIPDPKLTYRNEN